MLRSRNVSKEDLDDVVVSTVVPGIMHSFNNSISKYLNKKPFEIGIDKETGIKVVTPNPEQIGADRIVDAAAAFEIYGGPLIVIDYGTATTYDLISEDGAFFRITNPGLHADALWKQTAKLPKIEIKNQTPFCEETVSSMQAGLIQIY